MFHIQLQQHSRWSINLVAHWLCLHVYIQTNLDHSSHQSLVIWTTVIQNVYVAQNLRHFIPFSHQQSFIFYTITWLYPCIWNTHFLSTCHITRPPTFIHTVLIQFSLLWFITTILQIYTSFLPCVNFRPEWEIIFMGRDRKNQGSKHILAI
jgi:hypothetical protein